MTVAKGFGSAKGYAEWRGLKGRHAEPWFGSNDLDVANARPSPKMDKRGLPLTPFTPEPEGTEKLLTRNQRRMF